MTIHRLTAGSGYDYLTRQVARQDATETGHSGLGSYYTAKGEAPGVWVGAGMAGIAGLAAGDQVTAEHMTRLFGTGEHPLGDESGHMLGRPFRVYGGRDDITPFRIEVARRCESRNKSLGLPVDHPVPVEERAKIRTQVGLEMFRREHGRDPFDERELAGLIAKQSRQRTTAVAGFDLAFSPVKSVSTLWAVADRPLALNIEAAHQAAVRDALAYLEKEALFTRTGKDGVQQVDVRGMVAAAFTHRDSRAGDPDLHTHVAVANKVQTVTDGRWLSVDSRMMFKATVSASEVYNTALEAHLRPLGLTFAVRPDAPGQDARKRPVREVVGVDPQLNERWSTRRANIQTRRGQLAAQFQDEHGRPPNPVESIQLAQQATLETRDAKHEPRSEAEQRQAWRAEALDVLGDQASVQAMVDRALAGTRTHGVGEQVDTEWIEATAERVLDTVQSSRSAWQVWHVRAEAQRRVRGADVTMESTEALVEELTARVLQGSMAMRGSDEDQIVDPPVLRRADGSSVYSIAGSRWFTSTGVLEAEQRLVDAAGSDDGRRADAQDVELALLESVANGVRLNAGQATLVRAMATSGARVQLAIAPAGSGKTTAMRALARAWESSGGTVIGLAPSAAAAAVLRENAQTTADTLAKLVWHLEHSPDDLPEWARAIDERALVVIDEAGMVDTLSLDRAVEFITARGGSVRLIGDDQQLASVGAGGVLRDIRATHGALHLTELMRFTGAAEGAASLELRDGAPSALGFYLDSGRVHVGDLATMSEEVFQAWRSDRGEGRDSIMLAPTRDLVSELNQRARDHRLQGTMDPGPQATLADGNHASTGEVVITRRNDRHLRIAVTDWVKNGDRWTVQQVRPDGSLAVQHYQNGRQIVLPADYVAASVELGYASTVHTAQGVSVDVTHSLATGAESRQQLYTMMTRGRHANHVYLEVVGDGDEHEAIKPATSHPRTATDVLENILARDDSPTSATTMLSQLDDPATLLGQASARYVDALYTAAGHTLGQAPLERLDQAAQTWVPGISEAPAWPTLRAHLTLMGAAGEDPVDVLREAVFSRELGTAADPAAVLDWRLDDTGMRNTTPGPLPWIPGIPTALEQDAVWGDYLTARADRVSALARQVADQATSRPAPAWASQGAARPPDRVLADVAVWRAAHQVDAADLRPTGPPQPAKAPATYQAALHAQVQGGRTPAVLEWDPLLSEVAGLHADPFTPVLAERLAAASRAGIDAATLVRQATRDRRLPDDHAAAALWWRVAGHLAPAVATAPDATHQVSTQWVPALAEALGQDRVEQMQASSWWPVLVTTVDHALQRGWPLTDLTGTAPPAGADVDDAQAMTWTISTLMDEPTHLVDPTNQDHQPEDDEHADLPPAQHSLQATDTEYRQHIDTLTADESAVTAADLEQDPEKPDELAVNAGLALATAYRRLMGPLDPSEQELDRANDRAMEASRSPVPLQRLAAVNAMALDFYEQQLIVPGGWARAYLADRLGQDVAGHEHLRPGYAPPGWTTLTEHLRRQGVTDTELAVSGLSSTTRDGRLIDRFRDRAVFAVTDQDGQVLGFVGRRNPAHTDDTPHAGPKYLNTPTTPLFSKGAQLYGTNPALTTDATPVLVEGPLDAHAITLATQGRYVGLAPLGTALTQEQSAQLARLDSPVIIATDADLAGHMAAERAHWLLVQHNIPTFAATLPEGTDPADLLQEHGAGTLTSALLASTPLSEVLMQERLANLSADQALEAIVQVLATAAPSTWGRTCQEVSDRLDVETDTTRRALHRAVRTWHDDPRAEATRQLDNTRAVRARLQAAAEQTLEQRWATTADRLDPRLTAQADWPALARTMQDLHQQGFDVEALSQASIADEALLSSRPAQALRYRLAVIAPPVQSAPHVQPGSTRTARRDEDHHLIHQPGHDRPGRVRR
ncbi:relaxase domain-containing protein [Ornithinimicrobium sp. F0845]|uniref:MobF family relaxase n=1 Tax=Ornithinimicrobium sp. F0845 TaxID=2926412 RepID=UPI001FF46931|nr:MobF family relaxase [Ornithinimicrobium sp. F0845]MCK0111898.1 relaxase domain-containing protein [Ornithinimicrobium sp. F0845]